MLDDIQRSLGRIIGSPYRDVVVGAQGESTFHKSIICDIESHEEGCSCRDLFRVAGRLFRRKEIDFDVAF